MNILIVGNGFDLSHYLPTKYDHFMAAMQAVQNWDVSKGDMQFDDLFSDLYQKEATFFGYTKAMYDTSAVKLTVAEIENLKEQLKENVWYQYFLQHVLEVKTWIDFETKMGEALEIVSEFFEACQSSFQESGIVPYRLVDFKRISGINNRKIGFLMCFGVILSPDKFDRFEWLYPYLKNYLQREEWILNPQYFVGGSDKNGFNFSDYQSHLMAFHKLFTDIFNNYLILVNKLESPQTFVKPIDVGFERVYSFDYTPTSYRFYDSQDVEFIHGQIGTDHNVVLGVSDLDEIVLKKYKMYGFTKYHQKLLKNTDYKFLFENSIIHREIKANKARIDKIVFDIRVWGHSLDVSDQEYIKEMFSFNEEVDQHVRVKIFYFNDQAKFDLLSNLLHILGKEKVETWMKNQWLSFEPNPNIAELNGITPVNLSGYNKAN